MFDILTKKTIFWEYVWKKTWWKYSKIGHTASEYNKKKAHTKENWHCKEKCEHVQAN